MVEGVSFLEEGVSFLEEEVGFGVEEEGESFEVVLGEEPPLPPFPTSPELAGPMKVLRVGALLGVEPLPIVA